MESVIRSDEKPARVSLGARWYHLRRHGHTVGRKRIRRLMRKMGLQVVYQRPKTTVPHPEHKKWPYLLRGLDITRPNHVWAMEPKAGEATSPTSRCDEASSTSSP